MTEAKEGVEARALKPCPLCGNRAFIAYEGAVWCVTDRCLRLPPRETEQEAIEAWNTRAALTPPTRENAEGVLANELGNIRDQFERIAKRHPNEQPHYANGVRPFGTGDLRHFIEVLDTAIDALSLPTQPVNQDAVLRAAEIIDPGAFSEMFINGYRRRQQKAIAKAEQILTTQSPAIGLDQAAREAFQPIIDKLGCAEWAGPEHAEEILLDLIRNHHGPAKAALTPRGQS